MTPNLTEPWSEKEMQKFLNRQKRLEKIGMNEMNAESLAERLLYRDRPGSGDDRRICFECSSWDRRCKTPSLGFCTTPTVMQRCDGFVLKGSK